MPDYIPAADAAFNTWQVNFMSYANAHLAGVGLTAPDLVPLTTAAGSWSGAYNAHAAAQTAAVSASAAKEAARKAFELALRALVARIQTNPAVSDATRAALGIPVRSKSKTPSSVPTTRPLATVDTRQRLQHVISFGDERGSAKGAKPKGVLGAEIWVKVDGAPPKDESECQFLALDTASPYLAQYQGPAAGKQAHYLLRWINTRGEKGPLSEVVSATVVG